MPAFRLVVLTHGSCISGGQPDLQSGDYFTSGFVQHSLSRWQAPADGNEFKQHASRTPECILITMNCLIMFFVIVDADVTITMILTVLVIWV